MRDLGFSVSEEPFNYSAFPGRLATPIAGAVLGLAIVASAVLSIRGRGGAAASMLVVFAAITGLFARWMMRRGVLDAPWMRTTSHNLVATRGSAAPRVWLVAHLDSKSQPVSSAIRVAGVTLLALAFFLAAAGAVMSIGGVGPGTVAWAAIVVGVVGALPVMASVVGVRSNGAVDNASGVAAVLAAAALVSPGVAFGVLLPSAEELGLAGVRAWVRGHERGVALNCDGVDDDGALVIMYNRSAPHRLVAAAQVATRAAGVAHLRARRMPLGLLTDSTAFAAAGWEAATVSHGSLATLRRVHSSRDSLENLQGTSIGKVADVLARCVDALAT